MLEGVNTHITNEKIEASSSLSKEEQIEVIKGHFQAIMETLGLDLNDDSLSGTPERVAKMYVNEICSGLHPENEPEVSLFKNNYEYDGMLLEKDIELYSMCEHHFVPIIGKVHVAYFANKHVIGLSKINRIVRYYAKRPQVQERLTMEVFNHLKDALGTDSVAVIVDAKHLCVNMRGVEDSKSSTITSKFGGKFLDSSIKDELLKHINSDSSFDI